MANATPKYYIDIVTEDAKTRLEDETIRLLSTTKIPNHAFVVYQIPKAKYNNGEMVYTTGITVVNVEDQPALYVVNDLLKDLGKYCCHYNFPTHDHPDPSRAQKWKLYNDPNEGNAWDRLHHHCLQQLGHAHEISVRESALKAEIESLKRALEDKKKKGGPKDEQGRSEA